MNWREFVKKVQAEHGISYKEAMKKASPLWKEHKEAANDKPKKKARKAKKRAKKRVGVPKEVIDFPKVAKKRNEEVRQKIPQTQTVVVSDLGGAMGAEIDRRRNKKLKGRKRLDKKHGLLLDSTHRYLARKSKVLSRF